jgi:2-aminoethylphosphonate-pyruvate transaminase
MTSIRPSSARANTAHAAHPRPSWPSQGSREFFAEGGVAGRGGRYAENATRCLLDGMRAQGSSRCWRRLAGADHRDVSHAARYALRVPRFYDALKERGYVSTPASSSRRLVPDRLHRARLYPKDHAGCPRGCADVLDDMGVRLEPRRLPEEHDK